MMRFNRAIMPAKVLSFDLDDTLYDNHPIIKAALQAQQDYLLTLPGWLEQGDDFWLTCRRTVIARDPALAHDVTQIRKRALTYAMNKIGLEQYHADNAYQIFAEARSKITVSDEILALLESLKRKYRLIAITNGNVDVSKFNLKDQFELVLMAGPDGKSKPHRDLFDHAAERLGVANHEIIHIGDSLDTDVQGANNAGCRSIWLNNQGIQYAYKGLPCCEIDDIMALTQLG
ncbi:HAD-IA family hydrolase [Pseudoalteromonas sp. T1lg10]|uniref:HAD-IA family hydrolase n=1 Tax=Pseudoalteromonas sp. T1lg10 TaxID=2077093 RepID=UPI000CF74951|nr:HAD-IA family hydrolase [Pseudoalteromonas sp. T1lg10]